MAWYLNTYECNCGTDWTDEHCCQCDDECPNCGADISPSESEGIEQGSCGDSECPDCARIDEDEEMQMPDKTMVTLTLDAGTLLNIQQAMEEAINNRDEEVSDGGHDAEGVKENETQSANYSAALAKLREQIRG